MRSQILVFLAVALFSLTFLACGGETTPGNANNGNVKIANAGTNSPLDTTKAAPEQTTNNAPTLTPTFKAYCDAWVRNDEAALRKVYSSDTIKSFEGQMKEEKAKSLMKFLEDDKVSGTPCEVRNEQINGDNAVAEIRADKYPNGIKVVFVKENGEWKLTNKFPSLDSVKQTATNSNAAK